MREASLRLFRPVLPFGKRSLPWTGLVFLAALSARAEPANRPLSVTFDQVLTTSKGTFVTKVWIKGDKKRTEVESYGRREIDIIKESTYFQIFPDQGFAQKIPLASGFSISPMTAVQEPPKATEPSKPSGKGTAAATPVPIGTESVANVPCKIYKFKSDDGTRKIWMSDVVPFPLRWEEIDKQEGLFVYEVRNLKMSEEIPDSYFEVPEGIKVINATLDGRP